MRPIKGVCFDFGDTLFHSPDGATVWVTEDGVALGIADADIPRHRMMDQADAAAGSQHIGEALEFPQGETVNDRHGVVRQFPPCRYRILDFMHVHGHAGCAQSRDHVAIVGIAAGDRRQPRGDDEGDAHAQIHSAPGAVPACVLS